MTAAQTNGWQFIESDLLRRLQEQEWIPGDLIPREVELAAEYGCARPTVNRALNAIANRGLLDRKRKAGTRVATHPSDRPTVTIPIIRQEIESKNQPFSYTLITREIENPPASIAAQLCLGSNVRALHLKALYLADHRPYVFEDRWINTETFSEALDVDFSIISANEWLVKNKPYTRGNFTFEAANASKDVAELLGAVTNDALFMLKRRTHHRNAVITVATLTYHPGYQLHTDW